MSDRIIVIDDDEHVCELVRIALEAEGFLVDEAFDGEDGMNKIRDNDYCIVLLDIMLPEKDGWEICREIRNSNSKNVPIIMLTARGEEVDRVLGLELGADDYITKPFSPREMVARIKALLRRTLEYNREEDVIECGNLTIDSCKYKVKVHNHELDFTPKELDLLILLAKNVGKPLTREELLKRVWGFDDPAGSTRTIDEHIKRIRSKIQQYEYEHTYIHTVWGIGYKFEVK